MRALALCLLAVLGPSCEKVEETASCTDTQADRLNCGACGHSCWGGTCVAGRCQAAALSAGDPVWLAPTDGRYAAWPCRDGQSAVALCAVRLDSAWDVRFGAPKFASLDPATKSLAVVDGVIYWAGPEGLSSCAATGCAAPTPVLTAPQGELTGALIASGGGQLVWTPAPNTPAAGEIRRCSIASCAATQQTVYRSPTPPGAARFIKPLRTDGTWAVFMEGFSERTLGALLACRLDDCQGTLRTLTERTDNALEGFTGPKYAIHGGRVVWSSWGKIMTCVLPDCVPTELFTPAAGSVDQLDFDADAAYATTTNPNELVRCPLTGCSTPEHLLGDVMGGQTPAGLAITPGFFLFTLGGGLVKVAR